MGCGGSKAGAPKADQQEGDNPAEKSPDQPGPSAGSSAAKPASTVQGPGPRAGAQGTAPGNTGLSTTASGAPAINVPTATPSRPPNQPDPLAKEDTEESEDPEVVAKEKQKQAKKMIKTFVKEMVPGKKMTVVHPSGKHIKCACSLSRKLDSLTIKFNKDARTVKLTDIQEIQVGNDASQSSRVDTPVDDLCTTLVFAGNDAITFRFKDVDSRDTFVMCLAMFCQRQEEGDDEDDPDIKRT